MLTQVHDTKWLEILLTTGCSNSDSSCTLNTKSSSPDQNRDDLIVAKLDRKPRTSKRAAMCNGKHRSGALMVYLLSALAFCVVLYSGYALGMLVNGRPGYSAGFTRWLLLGALLAQSLFTTFLMSAIRSGRTIHCFKQARTLQRP